MPQPSDNPVRDLIEKLGGPSAVASALGLGRTARARVHGWTMTQSIPGKYWRGLIDLAAEKNVPLTADMLIDLAARRLTEEAA